MSNITLVKPQEAQNNAKVKERFDLGDLTSLERKQFTLCGMYPLEGGGKLSALGHNTKFVVLVIFSLLIAISMTVSLMLGVDNLSEVTAILYYLITQSAYILKLVNFMLHRRKLPLIERHLQYRVCYKFYEIFGHECLDSIIRVCAYGAAYFRVCVTGVLIFYVLVPLLADDILLPLAGWSPVSKEDYRGVLFALQIVCFFVSAYTNSSMDIYTAYYISIAVGELRLIKTCLESVDYAMGTDGISRKRSYREEGYVDAIEAEESRRTKDARPILPAAALGEILALHKHAITFVNMIESTFSYGIFIQFLASVVVICVSGFQMMLVSPASAQFFLLFFYFVCMVCQVILYCWYGNEVLFESSGIGEACYMSNWYEADPRYKKVLLIMMERSKRQIILTAGKFFILSLTTLVLIGKSSYSYFAVLRRIYKGD